MDRTSGAAEGGRKPAGAAEGGGEVGYRSRVRCPRCRFDNPAEARFCGQCGAELRSGCPACGAETVPGSNFCGQCGAPLGGASEELREDGATPRPKPTAKAGSVESEIKQATALCCEVVSEPPATDAEVLHDLLNRFLELAQTEIDRFDGTVDQVLRRGLLALFGAPFAQEDHAVRALLAASALRRRVEELAAETEGDLGVRWAVRMGLDCGRVVIGGSGGAAVGDAIDRARQLVEAAGPGAVLVGDSIARRVAGPFRFARASELGEGTRRPGVPAWRLGDHAPSLVALRRFHGWRLSPFVGREREMTLLEELQQEAEAGHGQVVGIAGEPGSGKSRLLHEHSCKLRGLPVSHLRGRCLSYSRGIPYFPFIDMIRRASGIGDTDDPAEVTAKLRKSLEKLRLEADGTLPCFLRLLGLREGTEPLDSMEPQAVKAETFRAMRRMVLTASRHSLVVMELEDLHWIDETSEEFLDSLIEEMAGARLLLLLTYRSGYRPQWLQKTYATQITMRRLSSDESRVLVDSILGRGEPGKSPGGIVERAEGNPFFLEELARSMADESDAESDPTIPATVQGVLMARIDRLPEPHKRLLQMGSVLDRELSLRLLQEVWGRPEPLPELLADLQRWELLYAAPSEQAVAYSFRHALTQEVTYQGLLKSRRRDLHARFAAALETLYADRLEEVYDRLIYHLPRAGDSEKTVHYLVLFAERAARQYAHAEAARALREALDHALRLPEETRDRRVLEVLLQLAESLLPLAHLQETLELCLAHEEALRRVDDRSLEARFRFWLAHTYTYLGHQDESREEAELALEAARVCGDEATEGKARYVLGRNAFWAGDFGEGLEQSQRAVVLLERTGEPWWQGQAYWVAGFHHWALGQFEQALRALERASEIGKALDDYRLDSSWSLGFVRASLGDWQAGIELCRRGIETSRDTLNTAVATGFLGYAYLQKGDLDSALQWLHESIPCLAEAGMRQLFGWLTAVLGEAYLAADRIEDGREAATEALQVSRDAQFTYGVGLARRVLGSVALAGDDPDEAVHQLDMSLETFRSLGAPFEVARTRLARAACNSLRGADATKEDLVEAHRLFSELGARSHVQQTELTAADLGLDDAALFSP